MHMGIFHIFIFEKLGNKLFFKLVSKNNRCDPAISNLKLVFSCTLNKCILL